MNPGTAVTFTVVATGTAPLAYQWYKDSSEIANATSSSYNIASVLEDHEGEYRCLVSNIAGYAESKTALLTVNESPIIINHPASQSKNPGNSVVFGVLATGTSPLAYQWQKGGNNIPGATSAQYTIAAVCTQTWDLPSSSILPEYIPEQREPIDSYTTQQGFTQINTSNASHLVWVDLEGDQVPELLASFPGEGLYIHYQDGSTTQLHSIVPDYFAPVDLDGDGKQELAITFSQFGLFIYRHGEGFSLIHTAKPSYYGAVDFNGDGKEALAINFSQLGFYTYEDGDIYTKLHFVLPEQYTRADMDGDGNEELIVSFQQYGFYSYDGVTFSILHSLIPVDFCNLDIDGDGNDELAISFDDANTYGLYIYSKTPNPTWTQIHSSLPASLAATDLNSDDKHELAITLSTLGLFIYEQDNGWRNIHTQDPEDLAGWTD